MEKNIYKEAILDAKAIRASAIANAKLAIQESIEPKIQEMMRLKLSEELEEELDEEIEENLEEETFEEGQEDGITEASLDEILAELDSMEEGKAKDEEDTMEEAKDEEGKMEEDYEEEGMDVEEAKKDDEPADEEGDDEGEGDDDMAADDAEVEVEDDTKVIDITLGDLKQVLQSVMAQGQPLDAGAETPEAGGEEESALSLDEILAELGEDLEEEGYEAGHQTGAAGAGKFEEAKKKDKEKIAGHKGAALSAAKEDSAYKKELEEANNAIQALRESLNDINLLNAKLLYMNKIFKAKSLSESEKIKVVKAFDRSASVKEVKNTYETLRESLNGGTKGSIKESIGFASKPIGSAPKGNIVESNDFVNRWQKIAGIK